MPASSHRTRIRNDGVTDEWDESLEDVALYENKLVFERVKRELVIDMMHTQDSLRVCVRNIKESKIVKRISRVKHFDVRLSSNGLSRFLKDDYSRFPSGNNTWAIANYLIDKHQLPYRFFICEVASENQAKFITHRDCSWRDQHLLKTYAHELCGVYVFSRTGLPHNRNVFLIVDHDPETGVLHVRGYAECDQDPRRISPNSEGTFHPTALVPTVWEAFFSDGFRHHFERRCVF